METQDHKKPKQAGHEGHSGGVHVCHKCGWPFPNPHPSAKNRRAHKKVCGTVEGYRLDNDAQDKTHLMDGSDGEHPSDDEHKTPSDKVVETNLSMRTSSGVGNRSSRSTRSEDEVFTDAVTEFAETPSPGEASDGGIQRFYSMQRVTQNDLDDIKRAADKADADNLRAPSILLNDNQDQVQSAQKLEAENDRVEAGSLSQDHIPSFTSGPALSSASIAVENENEDNAAGEINLSNEKSELRSSYNETTEESSEDVSFLRDMDKEIIGLVSNGELAKSAAMKTTGSENNVECSQASGHSVEVTDPASDSSKTGANADVYYSEYNVVVSMENKVDQTAEHKSIVEQKPVVEPVQSPDVKALDGDINEFSSEVLSDFKTDNVGEKASFAEEEQKPIVALNNVFPEEQKPIYAADKTEFTSNEASNTSNGVKINTDHVVLQGINDNAVPGNLLVASDVDKSDFRDEVVSNFKSENLEKHNSSCAEEQKPIVALNNVFPEEQKPIVALNNVFPEEQKPIVALNNVFPEEQKPFVAADNSEFTANGASNTSDGVKSNTEHVDLQEISDSDVSRSLLLAENAINDIPPQSKELSNIHESCDSGNNESIGAVQTHLDGSGIRNGGEGHEAVNADIAPSGSSIAASRDGIHETIEVNRSHDHIKSDEVVDSGEEMADHTLPMVESTGGSSEGAEKSAEEVDGVSEGDRIVKPQIAISGADILPDSSSQTDSVEGNWGSVSVMSAVSDTPPASDTPALNQSQASASKDNGSLELKPTMESQHSEGKSSVDPMVGSIEGESEIQTLEEQKEKGSSSALQTSWSSSVAHLENAPHAGKRTDEIIAKVNNWS